MKRKDFDRLINENNFSELFITEMGWNNPSSRQSLYIIIDEVEYEFCPVAEKRGFQVYSCEVPDIPVASECKKIDNLLRRYGNDYICVFVQKHTTHHLWLTPVKTNEKRELVKTEYLGAAQADFLFSKVDDLSFDLTEEVWISDVKARVHGSFHLNSERVTKDFYAQFRKEHKAFATHIEGLSDDKERDWYTSVMLNRLMFCYFIQKKGFLNGDTNYLSNKLQWVRQEKGEGRFFETFYKGFLSKMFHDGLNTPNHSDDDIYGRIPYLNGGMFDEHQLEREYAGIDINDEAFERLFNFFDKWNWHLDTRLTASGKDINPDVLGYIFEQYINDRAAMGAYYTKEDITEYIGKNCIIPFLMDKTASATQESAKAFEPEGWIWKSLSQSGGTYIYDAVKKGYSEDWKQRIPDYISQGIDTTAGNLLERRARWNEKTFEDFALPTEIWRETIERLQRCDSLLQKICCGEIHSINDFITYNLDIRQFVEDLIRNTQDHKFVGHFYHALQNVTILDPTCGSGAFLFAALNILEPLYEACLDRMEEWHRQNANLFVSELEEMTTKYSSNRQYFIYKSIILRNLYGVDIMIEATEIAKLRLFLKMVAVVEVDKHKDNLGLDPLPDIDFNIKCGNTLVGYATEAELDKALAFGDMFAAAEFKEDINSKMNIVATAYNLFRSEQLKTYDDNATIKQTKDELKKRLCELNDLLNHYMYTCIARGTDYNAWLATHQPFHWLAEFYQIIKGNGGFDVIIGNPPYVEYSTRNVHYKVEGYSTIKSSNLYSFVFERSHILSHRKIGLIVQMSSVGTDSMKSLQTFLLHNMGTIHYGCYPERPKQLFDGACIALAIILCSGTTNQRAATLGSGVSRCSESSRICLFQTISYTPISQESFLNGYSLFPKFSTATEISIINKLFNDSPISKYIGNSNNNSLSYRTAGGRYWKIVLSRPFATESTSNKTKSIKKEMPSLVLTAVLNSNLLWWYYVNYFDLYNFKDYMIFNFCYTAKEELNVLYSLGKQLMDSYEENKVVNKQYIQSKQKESVFESFTPQKSKPIIDEIDKVLAQHYSFTEEELDFIINYDIKYRMGDELSNDE